MGSAVIRTAAATAFTALSRALRLGCRLASVTDADLRSKLRVFEIFDRSRARPEPPDADLVRRVAARRDFDSLWEMEGIGYRWSQAILRGEAVDPGLLRSAEVPEHALLPLHTGCGMGFAAHALDGSSGRTAVERFLGLCSQVARPGWEGAMEEPLGLTARTLHPELLVPLGTELAVRGSSAVARLWHGVGRGLYFAPTNHLPWRDPVLAAVLKARREPAHPLGRANAAAGLAWAVTLVHADDPRTVERFVEAEGRGLPPAAVARGVAAARAIWERWSGVASSAGPCAGTPAGEAGDPAALLDGRIGCPGDLFHVAGGPVVAEEAPGRRMQRLDRHLDGIVGRAMHGPGPGLRGSAEGPLRGRTRSPDRE